MQYENNQDEVWQISSGCEQVQIISIFFQTEEGYDEVTINEVVYSGKVVINQIVPTLFWVSFSSDEVNTDIGFDLLWQCFDESSVLQGFFQ